MSSRCRMWRLTLDMSGRQRAAPRLPERAN